jgi:cell division protein FtsB
MKFSKLSVVSAATLAILVLATLHQWLREQENQQTIASEEQRVARQVQNAIDQGNPGAAVEQCNALYRMPLSAKRPCGYAHLLQASTYLRALKVNETIAEIAAAEELGTTRQTEAASFAEIERIASEVFRPHVEAIASNVLKNSVRSPNAQELLPVAQVAVERLRAFGDTKGAEALGRKLAPYVAVQTLRAEAQMKEIDAREAKPGIRTSNLSGCDKGQLLVPSIALFSHPGGLAAGAKTVGTLPYPSGEHRRDRLGARA